MTYKEFTHEARHFVKENKTVGGTYIFDYTTDTSVKPYTEDLTRMQNWLAVRLQISAVEVIVR